MSTMTPTQTLRAARVTRSQAQTPPINPIAENDDDMASQDLAPIVLQNIIYASLEDIEESLTEAREGKSSKQLSIELTDMGSMIQLPKL